MDDRRPDDKPAGSAAGHVPDAAPTEQFTPIPAAPLPAAPPPPAMTPPPAAPPVPAAGWQQPPQAAAPTAPPSGWVGPQGAGAPAQWTPASAQPGMMPPAAVYVREGGVTGLAKLGSLILITFGVLFSLAGAALLIIGRQIETAAIDPGLEQYRDLFGGLAAGLGIVILAVAIVEIIVGIFAWRGAGFARFIGIIYSVLFGLVGLAGIAGAGSTTNPPTTTGNTSIVPAVIIAVGYLYVAIVFIFRYRRKG